MQKPTVEPLPGVSGPAVPSAAQGGANVQNGTVDTPAPQQAQKTVSTGEAGAYRAAKPENVELPTVPIINLSMQTVADRNGGTMPKAGNYIRRTALEQTEARLGLDKNPAVYIEANNVTRNGDAYVIKITKPSLNKMLSASSYSDRVVPLESIAVLGQLERIAPNGVYFSNEGDRRGRVQIAGYDHLMTTVYIDGAPYLVDMRVRVEDERAGGGNQLYHFTPEAIEVTKKNDGATSTAGRHATSVHSTDVAPSSAPIIADSSAGGNTQSAQAGPESSVGAAQAGFTGDTVRGFCSDRAGSFRSNSLPWNSIQIIKEREYIHTLIIEFFMCRTEGDQHD